MANFVLLTQSSNMFTGFISKFFGVFIDFIYNASTDIGVISLGLTIILFTFIIRMLMFPLMYKQQQSMADMKKVQPEMKAIQDRYKNKKDQESQQKMQMEISELYKKHNVNPFGGCLPILIQFPIMLALFDVLNHVPAYISSIKQIYMNLVLPIKGIDGYETVLLELAEKNHVKMTVEQLATDNKIIDVLAKLNSSQLEGLSQSFTSIGTQISPVIDKINQVNYFFGINLSDKPGMTFPSIIIPILAVGTTALQSYLSMQQSKGSMDAQQAATNKTMMYMMPMMTLMFVFQMPSGLGLYWIAGGIVGIIQTQLLNRKFNKQA